MINPKWNIFPQMEDYDNMPSGQKVPFAMLSGPKSFVSKNINTDEYGFRKTLFGGEYISIKDIDRLDSVNILLGGSTAFGVGCTNDDKTIASILSLKSDQPWINMGIRGGVSFQEIIHLFRFIHKAKKIGHIVFFSGVNDVYANLLYNDISDYDRYYNEENLEFLSKSIKRQIICHIMAKLKRCKPEDLMNLSLSQMIGYVSNVNSSSIVDPLVKMKENIQRNFLIYSALKSIVQGKIVFVLQPFFYWTGKRYSKDEESVLSYLDQIQIETDWNSIKTRMTDEYLFNEILKIYKSESNKYKLQFIDSNTEFNINETLFVDSVHLNDQGNKIASDLIFNELYSIRSN